MDVNVSVNGVQLPDVAGGPTSGTPGMPGTQGMPDGTQAPAGDAGGMDVNVNVNAGGVQLPSLPGMPGGSTPGAPGMPTASGSGSQGSGGGIVYGSSNDPFGDLGTSGSGSGGMTAAERRAVLDARLEEGYSVFDGMILGERERAQQQADAAGSDVMSPGGGGGDAGGGGSGGGDDGGFGDIASSVIVASGGGAAGAPGAPIGGASGPPGEATPSFPVPEDIPSGNDDDVVARQLREAAMSEPDPELREKLWDEYRKYTGLPAPAAP